MNTYNPEDYLLKIQKLKYKYAALPISLVVISFLLNRFFQIEIFKYISLVGLLAYVFVIMLFKIDKTRPNESENTEFIVSPICGRITDSDGNIIKIKKSIFQPADLRCPGANTDIKIEKNGGKLIYFEDPCKLPGKLIGIALGNVSCSIQLPATHEIGKSVGDKVFAGESILYIPESDKVDDYE